MHYINNIESITPLLEKANHVDVKTITGQISMKAFIAALLSYSPWWIKGLYGIRAGFVRLLGMKQDKIPEVSRLRPEDISMTPGETAIFLTVYQAKEDEYWIGSITEKHLTAFLGVAVERLNDNSKRFYVITTVHYNHWTGPIYFNVIRPFHHLVVWQMMKAGIRG